MMGWLESGSMFLWNDKSIDFPVLHIDDSETGGYKHVCSAFQNPSEKASSISILLMKNKNQRGQFLQRDTNGWHHWFCNFEICVWFPWFFSPTALSSIQGPPWRSRDILMGLMSLVSRFWKDPSMSKSGRPPGKIPGHHRAQKESVKNAECLIAGQTCCPGSLHPLVPCHLQPGQTQQLQGL